MELAREIFTATPDAFPQGRSITALFLQSNLETLQCSSSPMVCTSKHNVALLTRITNPPRNH